MNLLIKNSNEIHPKAGRGELFIDADDNKLKMKTISGLVEFISSTSSQSSQPSQQSDSSTTNFYLTNSYNNIVEKIYVSGGYYSDWEDGMDYSLEGEYTILDPSKFGEDRIWVCNSTISGIYDGTEYASTSASIGCRQLEEWDSNTSESIYIKYWTLGKYYKTVYDYPLSNVDETPRISSVSGLNSPLMVQSWSGGSMHIFAKEFTLSSNVNDNAPYGPSSWNGYKMEWQSNIEIYALSGAGLDDVNGYYVRRDQGTDITPTTEYINLNGKSLIRIDDQNASSTSYVRWRIYLKGLNSDKLDDLSNSCYLSNGDGILVSELENPFTMTNRGWERNSSNYGNNPKSVYSNEGYYPLTTLTRNLPIRKNSPIIGKIYNDDGSIRIAEMYPLC